MERKDFKLQIKSVEEDGTFVGYAAVFDNVDLDGDRIDGKAFNRTLQHFKGQVPILWQHMTERPVGLSSDLEPDRHGLVLKGSLLLTTESGREAYEFVKAGVVRGLSIGYEILDATWDGSVRVLKELRLHEISLVSIPANPAAQIVAVKEHHPAEQTPGQAPPETAPATKASDSDLIHSLVQTTVALTSVAISLKEITEDA